MSARDLLLPQSALSGLLRSNNSYVTAARKRISRWPGAAVQTVLSPNSTFVPGSSYTHNWLDVASIEVYRGSWLVVAEAAVKSLDYSGYSVFWVALRLNGSDDASAEERTFHNGSPTGMRTSVMSFSTFTTTQATDTITLQVSQTTGAPSPPIAALRPTLLSCSIIARPN
jgi:hypothetical protein